jgi:hypothetical protein
MIEAEHVAVLKGDRKLARIALNALVECIATDQSKAVKRDRYYEIRFRDDGVFVEGIDQIVARTWSREWLCETNITELERWTEPTPATIQFSPKP